jgi:pimeloyl-ACP methyl ester carboxylesterase
MSATDGHDGGGNGSGSGNVITLKHGKSRLALHLLREGWGRPLLILSGLGEPSPTVVPPHLDPWGGPIYALDVTGHGASTRPVGGGYTAEILMADVDAAIAHLGKATVFGRGLGAYLALLIGGGRPADVRGIILADGPGLVGGGIRPGSPHIPEAAPALEGAPDPFVLAEMSRDVRPPDYSVEYVRQIMQWSEIDQPIAVTTVVRPEWLADDVAETGDFE